MKTENLAQFNYYFGQMKEIKTKNGIDAAYKVKSTVVVLVDRETGFWARGVAICNDEDNFCKKTGNLIALNRAKKALSKRLFASSEDIIKVEGTLLPKIITSKIQDLENQK